eukprot:XP_022265965.1 serine dehydratase-like isoform X3 [Canis lupus familiaris]
MIGKNVSSGKAGAASDMCAPKSGTSWHIVGPLGVAGMDHSRTGCAKAEHFHVVTPLLESWALSQVAGVTVFLKCENVQPAGSFKIRGIGHFCQEVAKKGCRHLVCSSGGNAGIAAAYAARKLGIPATIVLPEGTSPQVVKRLQGEGAEVQLTGKVWDEASLKAQELAKRDGWVNVHPFDHRLIWEGHASLVRELKAALGTPPGALVLAVGGGGLLAGVSAGLAEVGWQHVPIIAVETRGAHCFNAAIKAGRLVTLPEITRHTVREREAETQAEGEAGSMHREPDVGFDPGSPGSRPGPKAGAKPLRHTGIPIIFISDVPYRDLGILYFLLCSPP